MPVDGMLSVLLQKGQEREQQQQQQQRRQQYQLHSTRSTRRNSATDQQQVSSSSSRRRSHHGLRLLRTFGCPASTIAPAPSTLQSVKDRQIKPRAIGCVETQPNEKERV